MISIHLSPEDLLAIRFAYSPLLELVTSYRMLGHPKQHLIGFPGWEHQVAQLQGMDFSYLNALMTDNTIADFLMPTPKTPIRHLDDVLIQLKETPHEQIFKAIADITQGVCPSPIQAVFLDNPQEAMNRLLEELYMYWECIFAEHWSQIIPTLDNEILSRARSFALDGVEEALNHVSHNMRFKAGILHLDLSHFEEHVLGGAGIQMVPSIFKTISSSYIRSTDRSMLIYPAAGIGNLRLKQTSAHEVESLRLLIGESKSAILSALSHPQSTQELATRLHLTEGAVSQHLKRLSETGLVESHRSGYYVYYRLSERGQKLLDLFDQ